MTIQNQPSDTRQHKILIMDDEDYIRNILTKMFEKFGYLVELTCDGDEAVQRYKRLKEDGDPADLVILDLSIPGGMGGKEASQKILDYHPQAKIIISTGNPNDPLLSDYSENGIKSILPKPFRLDSLIETVKQIILAS